jgi:outer membrane receptor protein involved in Fe transport
MSISRSKFGYVLLSVLLVMLLSSTGFAGPMKQEQKKIKKYFKMDLYQLLGKKMTTAGRQKEEIREIPASVVLVTREEIERYGYTSLEEILSNIPGLYLIDDYFSLGTKIYGVRGFFSTGSFDEMIVLINGVNQVENIMDSYLTEKIAVPVEAIDRIEVVRGPMSVVYGSGAFFGAINIITHDADKKKPESIISASVGTLETYKIFARLSGKKGEFNYSFNGAVYQDGGVDEPFDMLMTDASPVTAPPEVGGWNLSTDRTGGLLGTKRKYFNFSGKFKDLTFDFGVVNSSKGVVETLAGAGDGNMAHLTSAHAAVRYKKKLSGSVSIEGKFTYSHDYHWVDNEFFFPHSRTNNLWRMNAYDIELNGFFKPIPELDITVGLYRRTSSFFGLTDYPYFGLDNLEVDYDDLTTHALFTQVNYKLSKKLKVVAGLRLEKPEDYMLRLYIDDADLTGPVILQYEHKPARNIELIPRLALIYSLDDKNIFKFLYGKSVKQPPRISDFDVILSPGAPLVSSQIQTFELNYIAAFSKKFLVNLSLFRNELDNLISRTNILEGGEAILVSGNAGKMSTTGVEAGIQATIGERFKLDLSVTYQSSKNKREGFENITLGYSPKVLGYIKASYSISDDIILALTGHYVDKMEAGWDLANLDSNNFPIIPPGHPYQGRLGHGVDGYFVLSPHLRINKLFNTGLYLSLKVSNLLDEEVRYPTTTSNPLFDRGTLGFGRRFLLSVGYKF